MGPVSYIPLQQSVSEPQYTSNVPSQRINREWVGSKGTNQKKVVKICDERTGNEGGGFRSHSWKVETMTLSNGTQQLYIGYYLLL